MKGFLLCHFTGKFVGYKSRRKIRVGSHFDGQVRQKVCLIGILTYTTVQWSRIFNLVSTHVLPNGTIPQTLPAVLYPTANIANLLLQKKNIIMYNFLFGKRRSNLPLEDSHLVPTENISNKA